jgi:hypothetical protein
VINLDTGVYAFAALWKPGLDILLYATGQRVYMTHLGIREDLRDDEGVFTVIALRLKKISYMYIFSWTHEGFSKIDRIIGLALRPV